MKTGSKPLIIACLSIGIWLLVVSCKKKKDDACTQKAGQVLCGYCSEDALTSNNPNAGKCIYCPAGTVCSTTDACDPNLQCITIDPPNTITHNLRHDVEQRSLILYQGPASDTCTVCTWYVNNSCAHFNIHPNPDMKVHLVLSSSLNFSVLAWYAPHGCGEAHNGEIASVGSVSGLGEVKTIPSGGWSGEVAAQKRRGYVIRYKKAYDYRNPRVSYTYARAYVVDYLTSATTGGILGVVVKYESPFNP